VKSVKRIVLVAALAIAVGAAAPAASAAQPVAANLAGNTQFITGWCCGEIFGISGSGVVRGIGMVTFNSQYLSGVDPFLTFVPGVGYVPPFLEERALSLTLTAPNGDALVVSGSTNWSQADPAPPLTWTVVSGTGRFATVNGSGTYQVSLDGATGTVTLSGALDR
jgi:hypothetical protein